MPNNINDWGQRDNQDQEGFGSNSFDFVEEWARQIKEVEHLYVGSIDHISKIIKKQIEGHEDAYRNSSDLRKQLNGQIADIERKYAGNYFSLLDNEGKRNATQQRQRDAELIAKKALEEKARLMTEKQLADQTNSELMADFDDRIAQEEARFQEYQNVKKQAAEELGLLNAKQLESQYKNELNYLAKTNKERKKAELDHIKQKRETLKQELKDKLDNIDSTDGPDKEQRKKQVADEYEKKDKELQREQQNKEMKQSLQGWMDSLLGNVLSKMGAELDNQINKITALWAQNEAKFNSRLNQVVDSDLSLRTVMDNFTEQYASANAYIKQEDLMKKAIEAVDAGIAYNIEERAFLSTISDSIQSTFDAFDSNLLQLIRLQRADMTASQLGLESALNSFLLTNFQDTSYLTDAYDDVFQSLTDLLSTMDRDNSTEVLYEIQKWLGSLYSVGASKSLVQTIAQGLNYLGTGNIEGLFGNTATNTLFGLAASYSNIDYADLIRDGLDSSSINALMLSMIDYLKSISKSTNKNMLVQGAYNQIFGTTMADVRAISNLSTKSLITIAGDQMTYENTLSSVIDELKNVSDRVSLITKVANVWDNYLYSSAESIANNPATMFTYKILDIVEDFTGGIALPSFFTFGTGLNLSEFRLTQLLKGALFGLSMITNIDTLFGGLQGSSSGISLPQFDEYMTGGTFSSDNVFGVSGASAFVSSGSSSDAKKSALASATEDEDAAKEISESAKGDDHDFNEWYENVIEDDKFVRTTDTLSHKLLEQIYLSMTFLANEERVQPVLIQGVNADFMNNGIPTRVVGTPSVRITQSDGKDVKPIVVKTTSDENIGELKDMLDGFVNGNNVMTVKSSISDPLQVEMRL